MRTYVYTHIYTTYLKRNFVYILVGQRKESLSNVCCIYFSEYFPHLKVQLGMLPISQETYSNEKESTEFTFSSRFIKSSSN